jgi:hypothetical protein
LKLLHLFLFFLKIFNFLNFLLKYDTAGAFTFLCRAATEKGCGVAMVRRGGTTAVAATRLAEKIWGGN